MHETGSTTREKHNVLDLDRLRNIFGHHNVLNLEIKTYHQDFSKKKYGIPAV